ncbi:MAG: hypothetical protein ABIA66_00170 [Candidatus Omnitrophota bacterium]
MRTLILIVATLLLMGCAAMAQPQKPADPITQSEIAKPAPIQLNLNDGALILKLAIEDIRKQGCEPLFKDGDAIWVECKGNIKLYRLQGIIRQYVDKKKELAENKKDEGKKKE